MTRWLACFCIAALCVEVNLVAGETALDGNILTLDKAVALALEQSPDIRKARSEIERTRGQVIEVRAQALPRITLTSNYSQEDPNLQEGTRGGGGDVEAGAPTTAVDTGTATDGQTQAVVSDQQFTDGGQFFGFQDKSWRVAIEGRQLLYAGGQVRAALNIARLTEDSSYYTLLDTVSRVIETVRRQFYEILLNRALIRVQEQSVELLEQELSDQQKRFEVGTVPRFNVLRAEVELANVRPELIRARNNYVISQLQLARTLGVDYAHDRPNRVPFDVVGVLAVTEQPIGLDDALAVARERRAFLKVQRQTILIETERIKLELAGYKPRIEATASYEWRNSRLSEELDDVVHGWLFGVQGSWDIFDGFETHGRVKQARARLESALVNYEDAVRQVELEVQQANANLLQARELIESQVKNVEQAEEALRLARERFEAGAGTQLEVLDARVALIRARVTALQARYEWNVAMAELDRVTGIDTVYRDIFDDPLPRRRWWLFP
jgi:outer membrane protein